MSGPAGAEPLAAVLGLGLDVRDPWHQRAARTRRALVQSQLLTGSALPPPTADGGRRTRRTRRTRSPARLPSLVATAEGPRKQSGKAQLSLSEPSLLAPNEVVLFEGFSCNRVSQKRHPPPPPFSKSPVMLTCKACHPSKSSEPQQQNHQQVQSCSRPAFIHFSQAIRPSSKQRPVRRHSHDPVLTAEEVKAGLQPPVMQQRHSWLRGEPLSVIGKPCLRSCSRRPAVTPANRPARAQLHVFLPTEAEGEEADRESVDEGFMDELDCKITSLKLQQGAAKTVTYH